MELQLFILTKFRRPYRHFVEVTLFVRLLTGMHCWGNDWYFYWWEYSFQV